jgi:hypothetical protein
MKAYGSYGLLLGALLTVVYGYAAQAAMARDLDRVRPAAAAPAAVTAYDRIWYGGVLAPITVQGSRPQPSAFSRQPSPRPRGV